MCMKTNKNMTICPKNKATFLHNYRTFHTNAPVFCRNLRLICHFWRRGTNSSLQEIRATGILPREGGMARTPITTGPTREESLGEPTMCQKQKGLAENYTDRTKSYVVENTLVIEFRLANRREKGELKKTDEPTMLMKTKEEGGDILDDPTMLLKTKQLIFLNPRC